MLFFVKLPHNSHINIAYIKFTCYIYNDSIF